MSIYGAANLAASFRTVRKNTLIIAEEIPEESYGFAPSEGTRTVAKLLVHMAVAPRIWQAINQPEITTLEGFDFMTLFMAGVAEEQTPRTKAEIIALLKTEGENFATYLEGLSDEFLSVMVEGPAGQPSKSRLESLLSPKEHEMHHRGQLMVIERLLGIKPHMTRQMEERFASRAAAKS